MKHYNEVVFKVSKRQHEVDDGKLKHLLAKAKKESGLTNNQISELLDLPKTMVEHWFRKDKYFSISTKDVWMQLKELLKIQTDEFDDPIMMFVEQDGVFDMGNRVYSVDGICPTISANQDIKIYDKDVG